MLRLVHDYTGRLRGFGCQYLVAVAAPAVRTIADATQPCVGCQTSLPGSGYLTSRDLNRRVSNHHRDRSGGARFDPRSDAPCGRDGGRRPSRNVRTIMHRTRRPALRTTNLWYACLTSPSHDIIASQILVVGHFERKEAGQHLAVALT